MEGEQSRWRPRTRRIEHIWKVIEMSERLEVMMTTSTQDGKLFLKADELKVVQRHEGVETKREYCHIMISLKGLQILHWE